MSLKPFVTLMTCLGLNRKPQVQFNVEKASYEANYSDNEPGDDEMELAASRFVSLLITCTADPSDLHLQAALRDTFDTCSYNGRLAEWILGKLTDALRHGTALGKTGKEASGRAAEAAVDFAKEHPAYCTLIALGILVIMAPWVLEILGFAELGPVEGSFAALWQARYGGYVPKGSLFSYFQRLGMVWH